MTARRDFHVVARNAAGAALYSSWHRSPRAAGRRLASLISRPGKFMTWGPDDPARYPVWFLCEDYRLHDSGAPFQSRALNNLRACYGA